MDKAIASENAHQFIKALVELGGIRYVGEDGLIYNADDTPVGVRTGVPPKNRPVAVFKEGMKVGDYVVLNPFTDILGASPERALFTNWMCAFPGSIIRFIIRRMIEMGVSKDKKASYKANKFIAKWIEKMDDKLIDESQKIIGKDWAIIFYDRNKKIAQLQSNIGTEELKKKFATKIRKSSWPVFTDMIRTLLQTGTKKPESLMYESQLASIPKLDAILHLLIDVLNRLDVPIKEFTDTEINVKELEEHLKHLDAYREATKWFASATASPDAEKIADGAEGAAPWAVPTTTTTESPSIVPVSSSPFDLTAAPVNDAMTIAKLKPVGVIYNENFGDPNAGGIIPNPTFGGGFSVPTMTSGIRPW